MKKWRLELTIEVSQNWVDDGFDLKEREDGIKDAFANMLPFAYDHEVRVEIKSMTEHQFKKDLSVS